MEHFDLIIVGTGSGNSILDDRFKDLKVALIERGTFGGTCLNVGCIPTKMLVHTADLARTPSRAADFGLSARLEQVRWAEIRDRIFGKRIDPISSAGREYRAAHADNDHVRLFETTARFVGPRELALSPSDGGAEQVISGDQIILAAGSRPSLPPIDGLDDVAMHTSDTIMRLDSLPESMTILGSGFIAAEFAHVFSALGVSVTQIARSGALLRSEDQDISQRFTDVASNRWDVLLDTQVHRAETLSDQSIRLHARTPLGPQTIDAQVLLVATGRTPNTDILQVAAAGLSTDEEGLLHVDQYQRALRGGQVAEGIWALGDLCSPYQLKHVANHEQRIVQYNVLHPADPKPADHRFVPHAVFSSPQIASVGLTEAQAREQGVNFSVAHQDYADIAYGWAMEDSSGFAKLLADKDSGLLIGAHIIGPQASTLIQPLIQAMSFAQPVSELARGQYWIHPALPELIENALLKLEVPGPRPL